MFNEIFGYLKITNLLELQKKNVWKTFSYLQNSVSEKKKNKRKIFKTRTYEFFLKPMFIAHA